MKHGETDLNSFNLKNVLPQSTKSCFLLQEDEETGRLAQPRMSSNDDEIHF